MLRALGIYIYMSEMKNGIYITDTPLEPVSYHVCILMDLPMNSTEK